MSNAVVQGGKPAIEVAGSLSDGIFFQNLGTNPIYLGSGPYVSSSACDGVIQAGGSYSVGPDRNVYLYADVSTAVVWSFDSNASASNSSNVSVAGTVNVGNALTIASGSVSVANALQIAAGQSVAVNNALALAAGTAVAINGTPSVSVPSGVAVTNTPAVSVPSGVAVSNTPDVTVSTGVAINGPVAVNGNVGVTGNVGIVGNVGIAGNVNVAGSVNVANQPGVNPLAPTAQLGSVAAPINGGPAAILAITNVSNYAYVELMALIASLGTTPDQSGLSQMQLTWYDGLQNVLFVENMIYDTSTSAVFITKGIYLSIVALNDSARIAYVAASATPSATWQISVFAGSNKVEERYVSLANAYVTNGLNPAANPAGIFNFANLAGTGFMTLRTQLAGSTSGWAGSLSTRAGRHQLFALSDQSVSLRLFTKVYNAPAGNLATTQPFAVFALGQIVNTVILPRGPLYVQFVNNTATTANLQFALTTDFSY